ncbi:23S rRNA (pseudouridine(1915)-N(3))-methyltransferase RlmH [Luteithermobacter gelatinilyticus]|uniref:23S rRNA (pseudouridine(1915)-N(3))-methyltransferase RlmH n=1 Tax=Luteithermobacter gelatinilyticus TaxID=2582913 RepID=UPI0011060357|nr:23S rRNA (pseudouridine(1915)-N(3))-methyltransferase RlmH [Luteithermobacter gelatinilyticus]
MQIHIIAVGRLKKGPELDLVREYVKRTPWPVTITEVEEKRPVKGTERLMREAELILSALSRLRSGSSPIIALDERGKNMRSTDFAAHIAQWRDSGHNTLTFLIGGADGFAPEIREQADLKLSFGAMTWPHMMVRLMLCEQIYRASTILAGHPYHRE